MTLVCGMVSVVNLSGAAAQTTPFSSEACQPAQVFSLDGGGWSLAADPGNVGRQEKWWESPRADAKAITESTFRLYTDISYEYGILIFNSRPA